MTDKQKWTIFFILVFAQFMLNVDTTVVNIALPSLQKDFNLTIENLQWIVSAYILAFGGFLLLGGKTADLHGRRKVFLAGVAGFTSSSLLIGITSSAFVIISLRAIQGLSGAFMIPSALSMVLALFDEQSLRTRALSIWAASAAVGGTFGLLIGGVLTQYFSWRWNFLINVPVGSFIFILARRSLPPFDTDKNSRKLDVSGALFMTGGLMLLVYTITSATTWGWFSFFSIGLLITSLLLLAIFIYMEMKVANPLMPLSFFRKGNIVAANALMLIFSMTTLSTLFFLTLYNQNLNHFTPVESGLAVIPIGVISFTAARLAPYFIKIFGVKKVLVFAPLFVSIGSFLFAQMPLKVRFISNELPGLFILSFGMGLVMVALIVAATSNIPASASGLASGMINTFQQTGGSIGIAILASGAVATTAIKRGHSSDPQVLTTNAILDGYHHAFYTVMWFAVAVSVLTLLFIRDAHHGRNVISKSAQQSI
jgi:EmrB/QacA subfamily drug resistance transporter